MNKNNELQNLNLQIIQNKLEAQEKADKYKRQSDTFSSQVENFERILYGNKNKKVQTPSNLPKTP